MSPRPAKRKWPPEPIGPQALRKLFARCGIELDSEQVRKFWIFHRLLRRENERLDLTRLYSFTSIVERHYIDSAMVARLIRLPSPLLDLGTGAGFPGIPLKIMQPEIELLLSEGRSRRVEFLKEACRALGLTGVRILPHRITSRFTEPVNGVISRAVGSISDVLDRARGCLGPGGEAIFMKGPRLSEELAALPAREDFELSFLTTYSIPQTPYRRALAVFRRRSMVRKVVEIRSSQNERFKRLRSLLEARGIRKEGLALFAGRKIVPELLAGFADRVAECAVRGDKPPPAGLPEQVPTLSLEPELFDEIDPAGTRGPILIARVEPMPPKWDPTRAEGVSVLAGLQDPVNLGASIRLAAAFGVSHLVVLAEAANPYLPRSIRAAGPDIFKARLEAGPSINELETGAIPLVALSPDGEPLPEFRFPETCAILVGQEGPGLPRDLAAAARISVPMAPGIDSINAATALAVALYAYRIQHPIPATGLTTTEA